jgi:DNA-binding HxlR family transcriptional regulator
LEFFFKNLAMPTNVCNFANSKQKTDMAKLEITPEQERLARFAKAMGHPTRIAILIFLAQRNECFFGDIHEVLPIAKATVSQHLSELKEAGLIQGTIEPPKVKYCINPENWKLAKRLFSQMLDGCCPSNNRCFFYRQCSQFGKIRSM